MRRATQAFAASLQVRLGLAIFFAMNVMMTSMSSYVPHGVRRRGRRARRSALFGGAARSRRASRCRCSRSSADRSSGGVVLAAPRARASDDVLVMIAVLAAYGLSLRNAIVGRSEIYFDTAVMLLIFVTAGRWFRRRRVPKPARDPPCSPRPSHARRIDAHGDVRGGVALEELLPGDVVEVARRGNVPTDGIVLQGEAAVDESASPARAVRWSRPRAARSPEGQHRRACSGARDCARGRQCRGAHRGDDRRRQARAYGGGASRRPRRGALVPVVLVIAVAAGASVDRTARASTAASWSPVAGAGRRVPVRRLGSATLVVSPRASAIAVRRACRGAAVRRCWTRAANAARVVFDKTGIVSPRSVPRLAGDSRREREPASTSAPCSRPSWRSSATSRTAIARAVLAGGGARPRVRIRRGRAHRAGRAARPVAWGRALFVGRTDDASVLRALGMP